MKKFFFSVLILLLLGGPIFSFASAVSIADSVVESSESSTENSTESGSTDTSSENSAISNDDELKNKTESESLSDENLEAANTENTDEGEKVQEEVETEQTKVAITFITDAKYPFSTGETSIQIVKNLGETLSQEDIPQITGSNVFVGWVLDSVVISEQELLTMTLTEDIQLQAKFVQTMLLSTVSTTKSYSDASVKDVISSADKSKIIVVPNPTNSDSYATYAQSTAGLQQALYDMYKNGNNREFVLYTSNGTLTLTSSITAKTIPETVTTSNITFYALQNKVSRLIITGAFDDPITDAVTLTSGSGKIAFQGAAYFGADVIIRNLNYTGSTFYMNGHSLALNGGSTGAGLNIYGGTDSGDLIGNPTIAINATGSGTWNIYGGNQSGGTLTGNPSIIVNNTVGGINTIAGGANIGTVIGNITTQITRVNGTVTYFYGGGVGSSTSKTANVTGNITNRTDISSSVTNFKFSTYYGGVLYGDIVGSITNDISGSGGWNSSTSWRVFVGGSGYGNITASSGTAITSNLDTSKFNTYGFDFVGANRYTGTIKGDISNTVKAGTSPSKGGIGNFDGGGGEDATRLSKSSTGASNETTYDAYSVEMRTNLAYNAAAYRIIGNIDSHLVSGSFGNHDLWRTTAAGTGGYVEGNVTIEVGTSNADSSLGGEGFVYTGDPLKASDLYYSTSRNNYANQRDFDIAAGGYVSGRDTWSIYIKGNTHTVINNAVARRTYGGVFCGVVEGNTNITLNAGIVDTLEGAGYEGGRIYGNSSATVNNGQVDWFLTGGGWDDKKIVGNVSVTVHDGVINASIGGSYGFYSDHTVTGDSSVLVLGGNFSGETRTGDNGFSAGVTSSGSILGNATLTIDLRNYAGEFALPTDTSISAGRPPGTNTTLGTDTNNTITLNIYTAAGSDVLNGATIYGDGGNTGSAGNCKSGKIIMNIEAENSSIGTLYATNYPNVASSKITKDVTINVQGAASIGGISGGNGASGSNLTNTIVSNSTNKIRMNFGVDVDNTGKFQTDPINVTGIGIVNFTELNVTNAVKLMANGGDIKNGVSATASNHSSTYNQFGNIHLSKNGGIGITSSQNFISGASLIVEDDATLESPPGTGKVNVSEFVTPNADKDNLLWIKNTQNDASAKVSSQATTYGAVSAYQVLTVNPTIKNASTITQTNFSGIEKATGKTFVGDNDVTKSGSGYGIAIPGSIIEYEVESPVAEGAGSITHNVIGVKAGNSPLTIAAWGTDVAGVQVQKGRLFIPYNSSSALPTLTFTPEIEETGSWFYSGAIGSSKINNSVVTIGEQSNSNPVNWTSPDGEYSYTIKVSYSNQAELTAQNIIVTEQEVENLTEDGLLELINARGRPFLETTLTADMLNEINEPLGDEVYRKFPITVEVGKDEDNQIQKTVNIIVVRNESVISENKDFAVYAKAARLTLKEANAISSEEDLAQYTLATTIFADNRENHLPAVNQEAYDAIRKVTEAELLKNVSTEYCYQENGQKVSNTVNVAIAGELKLETVPTSFDFGVQKVTTTTQTYWPTIEDDLVVKDTRGDERSSWTLTVREEQSLTNGTDTLEESLIFVSNGHEYVLNGGDVMVEETKLSTNGSYIVNQDWSEAENTGIKLTVPVEKQKMGEYSGTLSWQLVSAPVNP